MKGLAIGIDIGTLNVRAVHIRNGITKRVSLKGREDGGDMVSLFTALREDAEVALRDFVTSCAVALPVHVSSSQKDALIKAAAAAGMDNARLIEAPAAAALSLEHRTRLLVFEFGAVASLSVVENGDSASRVLESVTEPGSQAFDAVLADWLRERLTLPPMREGDPRWRLLLQEAEKAKIALSGCAALRWVPPGGIRALPEVNIEREDLERLTRFPLRGLIHTARRLWSRYRPERLLLVGGASRTPLLQDILKKEMNHPELLSVGPEDAAAQGAAICASRACEGGSASQRLQEIKNSLADVEALLTREQQARLDGLFTRIKDAPSLPRTEELAENLARDLKRIMV